MALRFFGVISAAMMLCLLGLIAFNVAFGFGPPRAAQVKAETAVVLELAARVFRSGGEPALRRLADDLQVAQARLQIRDVPSDGTAAPVGCEAFEGPQSRAFAAADGCVIATVQPAALSAWDIYSPFGPPLGAAILIGALSAIVLARYFSWPLRTVGERLIALSGGHFSTRIGHGLDLRSDEIGALARAFNRSAQQLQDFNDSQRRLFHDVSHEIRSPLARLQAATGVLRRSPGKLEAMLPRIEGEIVKLDALIGQILTLARATNRQDDALRRQPLDLVDLLDPITEDANFEGAARGVSCTYSGPARLPLDGIGDLLHSALENVVRNAIRHAPDASEVRIWAQQTASEIVVEVTDEGRGVDGAEIDQIFAPFFRGADSAMPAGATPGGAGLGLAITARVMALHGGRAQARNLPGGGFVVRLALERQQG